MTPHAVATVVHLELLQRVRGSRWAIVLGLWFLVIGAVTWLAWSSLNRVDAPGPVLYDIVVFLVLGLGMLVVPSLTSTSINGDREHGVLACVQTTLLTPAEIVVGKLLAAWVVSLVLLAVTTPFLVWAYVAGGLGLGPSLGSLAVIALVLLVVCALGLMFSTLVARPVGSAVLTYLTTALLSLGTVLTFVLTLSLVSPDEPVHVYGVPQDTATSTDDGTACTHYTRQAQVAHTERTWWLLALNPFVVAADAAPSRDTDERTTRSSFMPMRLISYGVRAARAGADPRERQECWSQPSPARQDPLQGAPVWPWGLGGLLLIGAGATALAARRIRTPMRRLPNGTRVA